MIVFNIAEWIANLFILGIAFILWSIGVFIMVMLISMFNQWISNLKGEAND